MLPELSDANDSVVFSKFDLAAVAWIFVRSFRRRACCDVDPDEVSAVEPDNDERHRAGRNR